MVQIQPKQIANTEAHFVSAELKENIIEYKLYSDKFVQDEDGNDTDERVVIGSGSLATDGTITEENVLENALSSLGAQLLENGTE